MSVVVEQYNPEWPSYFQKIKSELEAYLRDVILVSIEHVGSTSVPGLAAKPIIDVDIIVEPENVQNAIDALVANGKFTYLGELGIADRHCLKDPNQSPARNIYICVDGAFQTRNHLGVRDTLCLNPALRDEYAQVKLELAAQGLNIVDYVKAKSGIVQKILKEAGLLSEEELADILSANQRGDIFGASKTERLTLREFEMKDIAAFHKLESIPEVVRYQTWPPRTLEQAHKEVATAIQNCSSTPRLHFELAVIYTETSTFIGRVGAKLKPQPTEIRDKVEIQHADLWFSFMPEYQGQGFATEAVKKFLELLVTRNSPLKVEIECDPRNIGSVRMAERLKFERVSFTERAFECKGEWVDSLVFQKLV